MGDKVDETKVQKIFILKEYGNRLNELIEEIPAVYLEITEMIVEYGEKEYGFTFSNSIYLQLTDHVYNAILHEKEGIFLKNPMFPEIMRYYKSEYNIAIEARRIILDKVGFEISEDEVAYIAMHIMETSSSRNKREIEFEVKFVNDSIDFIRHKCMSKNIVENTLDFDRLILHLKYFAKRYFKDDEAYYDDALLDETINKCFSDELGFAKKFAEHICEKYGKRVSRQELNYLALHFRNINLK